jgi:photosystem II stability/assembly factor-like uncharacterized protein
MKQLFFLSNLLLLLVQPAFAQWRSANPYNGAINDIFFTNRLTGFACGQSAGVGSCSGTTSIQRTIDGGETWIRMNTGSTAAMNRLHFVDSFTGWAVGASSSIIKTTDGGQTWTIPSSGVGAGLNDIHFPNANVGFVVGANGLVRKSSNGGSTWTTQTSGVTVTLNSVWFADANTGYFVGNSGTIRKTTNGGSTWTSVYSGTDFFREVWFADANNGYVLSNNKILKTTNGGSSWTSYDAPSGMVWLRMNFSSMNSGVIIGDSGYILKTNDGGQNWIQYPTDFNETMYCAYFLDENYGFMGSNSLGRIVRTIDGCQNWTNVNSGMGERVEGIDFRTPQKGVFVSSAGGIFTTQNGALNVRKMHSNTSLALLAVNWMNDSTIIACGDSGTILRSTNSGWSWTSIPTGTTETLLDMVEVDSLVAYSSGGNGMVIKTQDAGLSWTTVAVDSLLPLRGIHFLNRNIGMTVSDYAVFKTVNGGLSWELKNDSILSTSDFNDVWMTSANVAYAAGTFGRMYKTVDGGEIWRRVFPSDNTNAEIQEMQFFTDSIGYFARLNSQYFTLNGGTVVGSQSTYCLANNGGVDAIELPNEQYGYCTGGISNVLHTLKPEEMLRTYLQDSIFCSGSRIFVGYNAAGLLYNSNVMNVELSNSSGDFSSPTVIGTYSLQSPQTDPSGIITCTLPNGINGDNYRIRVVCVSPTMVAPDNGYPVHIRTSVTPFVSLEVSPESICGSDPVIASISGDGLGTSPTFTWSLNGLPISLESHTIVLDTLSLNTLIAVSISSSLTCANPIINTLSQSLSVAESPVAYAGNDTSLCLGETVQIGSLITDSFTWFPTNGLDNPSNPQPIASPDQNVSYVLTVTNTAGCSKTDTISIQVNNLPATPTIFQTGGLLVVEGDLPGTFNWFLDSEPIASETNDSLVITSTGSFTVQWIDPNGCSSELSNSIVIGTVGLRENQSNPLIKCLPNEWRISGLPENTERYYYSLFDVSGRMMVQGSAQQDGQGIIRIEPISLASGMYFLHVTELQNQTGNNSKRSTTNQGFTFKFIRN